MCAAFEFQPAIETKIYFDTDVNSWLCPKGIIDCIFFVFKVSVFSQRFFTEKKKKNQQKILMENSNSSKTVFYPPRNGNRSL